MECPVCMECLDQDARRPKVLPCGHCVCLACLLQLKEHICPTCRKKIPKGRVNDLPDNYMVMQMMANFADRDKQLARRWWCSTCRAIAKASCEDDGHHLQRPRPAFHREVVQLQEQLPQLQRQAHEQLQALAAPDTAEDKALAGLQCLGGPGASCELVLRRDGEPSYGAKWGVSESALEDRLLRALALVLVKDGKLTQQEVVQGSVPQHHEQECLEEGMQGPVPVPAILELSGFVPMGERDALLQEVTQQGVRRMTQVWCRSDPTWILQLLQCAAPKVEELQVFDASAEHLLAVHGMPRLRRLRVGTAADQKIPAALPPLPADHPGLQWLFVSLPRLTTIALLQAHGRSLQELWLYVGTGPYRGPGLPLVWPDNCEDLPALLQRCGLRALRRLVLRRPMRTHSQCSAQLEAVRRVLRGVTVQCDECDGVPYEF